MALTTSGLIGFEGALPPDRNIATELRLSTTALMTINDAALRNLAGVPAGRISLADFYGKSNSVTANFLLVAGGGAPYQASGGAGGVVQGTAVLTGSYAVSVGGGGAGGNQYGYAANGGDTGFDVYTAYGGGGGGGNGFSSSNWPPGSDGGSGGGGAPDNAQHNGGNGIGGHGYPGGFGQCWSGHGCWGGAGGGAAGYGQPGTGSSRNPYGGAGIVSYITGSYGYYANGGGNGNPGTYGCGDGYDGIAILSYQSAAQVATGGSVSSYVDGNGLTWWVHSFTSSGTFAI